MNIVDAIREFISKELVRDDAIDIPEDRPLIGDGLINSIGIAKLVAFLGERFDLRFEDDDYNFENFETLIAIQRLVERRSAPATA